MNRLIISFPKSRVAMSRPLLSYSRVQKYIGLLLRNRLLQLKRIPSLPFVNIGCGQNIHPGFINIDYDWHPGIHLCWDIRIGLPLRDLSIEGIFTEHCLEHVTYDQCIDVLQEMYRILKPNGVVRIIVPDGGLYIDLYQRFLNGEQVEFPYVDLQGQTHLREDSRCGFTPMMAINRIFRGYGHLFAYDYDTMKNVLLYVGFKAVKRCTFLSGQLKGLLIDSELRAPQSMFVEAIKY